MLHNKRNRSKGAKKQIKNETMLRSGTPCWRCKGSAYEAEQYETIYYVLMKELSSKINVVPNKVNLNFHA